MGRMHAEGECASPAWSMTGQSRFTVLPIKTWTTKKRGGPDTLDPPGSAPESCTLTTTCMHGIELYTIETLSYNVITIPAAFVHDKLLQRSGDSITSPHGKHHNRPNRISAEINDQIDSRIWSFPAAPHPRREASESIIMSTWPSLIGLPFHFLISWDHPEAQPNPGWFVHRTTLQLWMMHCSDSGDPEKRGWNNCLRSGWYLPYYSRKVANSHLGHKQLWMTASSFSGARLIVQVTELRRNPR